MPQHRPSRETSRIGSGRVPAPLLSGTGRALLGLSGVGLAVVPWLTDINRHHTFGPGWHAHARLHGVAGVLTSTAEGVLVTAMALGARGASRDAVLDIAAAIPVLHWLPFNLAVLVPTTSVDEEVRAVPRVLGGVPVNLLAQNVLASLAVAGYVLTQLARRRGA